MIADGPFLEWLARQSKDTQRDVHIYFRYEVQRHPYLKAHPEDAAFLGKQMVLKYASDCYGYEP